MMVISDEMQEVLDTDFEQYYPFYKITNNIEDTLHDPRVYYKFYMYFIVRSHPPENGAYYMNNLFGLLLIFDIYGTEYGTALTTILPILFLYLNTVTVTAGNFEP